MSLPVTVIRAVPRRADEQAFDLADGATVGDALAAAGLDAGTPCAVFGVRAGPATPLHPGDRVEILRPLQIDPKESRRRRAARGRDVGAR